MNMRERFLTSDTFRFEEMNSEWHDHPLFSLKGVNGNPSRNELLQEHHVFLGLTDEPLIFLSDLRLKGSGIDPDLLIFASRHRSKSGKPAFLLHSTGNWSDDTRYGGKEREVSKTSAILLKEGYESLMHHKALDEYEQFDSFSIDLEVSHHGPTSLDKPLIFMELGSGKKQWKIEEAAELVSRAILDTCFRYLEKQEKKIKVGIGFGGTHYSPQFQKVMRKHKAAVSFICPKYYIEELSEQMILQMIDHTLENVDLFLIDWKGTNSADKKHLLPILERFEGIPWKKIKKL